MSVLDITRNHVYDPCHKIFYFSDEQVTDMQIECWQKRPTMIKAVYCRLTLLVTLS